MWAALLFLSQVTVPQVHDAPLLVSASWLAEQVDTPNLVLLHVGTEETYRAGHIAGARLVRSPDWRHAASPLDTEVPDPAAFQEILRQAGINEDSHIVVYWSDQRLTAATRVVFTLDWAGLGDRTSYLDGGLDAWKAAGGAVSDQVVTPIYGNVTIDPRPDLIVTASDVQKATAGPGFAVLDARSAAVYDGVRETRGKAGHIPGAGSLSWLELIDERGQYKPPAQLRALFDAAGATPGDTVIAYCHIGQYATAVLLAARTLGYRAQLYDGSFEDWAKRDLPVERRSRSR